MKIHVMSLRRTPDRLRQFLRLNEGVAEFEVTDAVDGQVWSAANPEERNYLISEGLQYSKSAIGCALSHRALWLQCLDTMQPITICEDDALLHSEFQKMSAEFIERIPVEWDVIMWGWNFDAGVLASLYPSMGLTYMKFDPSAVAVNQQKYRVTRFIPAALRVQMAFGYCCYSVSPIGAEKLLKGCFPLQPFEMLVKPIGRKIKNFGIDVAGNALYPSMQVWAPFPPLALSENDKSISTIQRSDA